MTTSEPRPPLRSESLHQQVARSIRNQIQAGRLRHGEVLASTRELATQWDVSVFTINEAMRVLAEEGLVVSVSRSKRTVNNPDGATPVMWRPDTPRVVLVGGYPGCGKSELARILTRQTGWPMIDKDTLTRPVVEAALEVLGRSPNDRESQTYLDRIRPTEYEAVAATTLENVECGNSAIVAAPFLREFKDQAWIDRTTSLLATHKAITTLVWVHCDADTMHRYMRQRGAARDAVKLADWPKYLDSIDLDMRPPVPHEAVDNSSSSTPLQAQATALIERILKTPA
jgi:DNA-binding transcriptional regulator YhcF (GntR family)/predicted kinase